MNLNIKNIYKTYPNGYEALKGVTFEAKQGEIIALLGLSGSGKTTLLRIISGLEFANRGDIFIDEVCINDMPVQDRHFGVVFQDYALFPHLSVSENIAFGLRVQKNRLTASQIEQKVKELLEIIHIPQLANRGIHQLSGGQKQRVAMARALAIQPRLLLLDEPFSALDVQIRKQLRNSTKALQKQFNITSILVTHDQNEAFDMADKIAVMNNGIIEQIGTKEELLQNPTTDFVKTFINPDSQYKMGDWGYGI